MITEFVNIPDYFVERYNEELCAWGANFKKIGPVKSIVLREGFFSNSSPNEEAGAELIQVKLLARFASRAGKMIVEPYTERDKEQIIKHCDKMQRLKVKPGAKLIEPERPWIPFLPTIGRPN